MDDNNGQTMTLKGPDGRKFPVRLVVNAKARRLILRLDERKREIVAVAPSHRQIKDAAAFAEERVEWISARLKHLPASAPFSEGETIQFRGQMCQLTAEGPGRLARILDGDPLTLLAPGDPETLPKRVTRFLKKTARADIESAVTRHCATLKRKHAGVFIKDTRSRWGSCTADGRLSFSWRLIMAPPEVLDYVAAHECAHLLEMNHSPRFWSHVSRCCPGWKTHRAWLRTHGGTLQAAGH